MHTDAEVLEKLGINSALVASVEYQQFDSRYVIRFMDGTKEFVPLRHLESKAPNKLSSVSEHIEARHLVDMYRQAFPEFKGFSESEFYRPKRGKIGVPFLEKPKAPESKVKDTILIVAGTMEEARELSDIMGFASGVYVDHYSKMMTYNGATVYITGTARDRKDFGAIEGLFLRGDHDVVDMNE